MSIPPSSLPTRAARARLQNYVERMISIDEVKRWKPNKAVYLHAAQVAGVDPGRLALVAAHAWDVHGAKQAGLMGAWVKRQDAQYHAAMAQPDVRADSLIEAVEALLAL
jgi:2-haloacid dehalogenase